MICLIRTSPGRHAHTQARACASNAPLTFPPPPFRPCTQFGFVKSRQNEKRYFFHLRESDGQAQHNDTVTFTVSRDPVTGKDVATAMRTVPGEGRDGGERTTPRASTAAGARGTGRRAAVTSPSAPGAADHLAAAGEQVLGEQQQQLEQDLRVKEKQQREQEQREMQEQQLREQEHREVQEQQQRMMMMMMMNPHGGMQQGYQGRLHLTPETGGGRGDELPLYDDGLCPSITPTDISSSASPVPQGPTQPPPQVAFPSGPSWQPPALAQQQQQAQRGKPSKAAQGQASGAAQRHLGRVALLKKEFGFIR